MQKWILLFFLTGLSSCNNQIKFDKTTWNTKDDFMPCSCREQMVEDLTKNHKLVGIKTEKLKNIIGEPDVEDSSAISYDLIIDFGHDIDPVYTKTLMFYLNKDSTVKDFEVVEWHN